MSETRIRVQLQEGHNDLHSVTNRGPTITYLQVAMALRTLYENSVDLFPRKSDQGSYRRAVDRLCDKMKQARDTKFEPSTGLNQFREEFTATREGKTRRHRVDVEITGPLRRGS